MLTFDKIRDMEREERSTKKLQKLPADIIDQMRDYLRRKEKITDKTSSDIQEMDNVRNTIKRFFELREAKIINAAIDTVRTGMPPENMSKEEEHNFYIIVGVLKDHREKFFEDLQKEPSQQTQEDRIEEEDVRNNKKIADNYVSNDKKYVYTVKKNLSSFVGPDGKIYELKENDTIELEELPKPLNDLLIKEGVIEKVQSD
jgi:DNA replication initiation complex subunit (GINS family)